MRAFCFEPPAPPSVWSPGASAVEVRELGHEKQCKKGVVRRGVAAKSACRQTARCRKVVQTWRAEPTDATQQRGGCNARGTDSRKEVARKTRREASTSGSLRATRRGRAVPQQNVGVRAPDGAASPSAERLAAPASPAAAEVVTARFGWPPPPKKEAMDACLPLAGLGSDILATREPSNACAAGAGRHSERLETPASTVLHNRMRSPPTGIHGCVDARPRQTASCSPPHLLGRRQLLAVHCVVPARLARVWGTGPLATLGQQQGFFYFRRTREGLSPHTSARSAPHGAALNADGRQAAFWF